MNNLIATMMHGLGDSSSPLPETVKLVEEILAQQVRAVVRKATDCAGRFRNPVARLTVEDFVFLYRRSPVKLHRLLLYISGKEKAKALEAGVTDVPAASPLLVDILKFLRSIGINSYPLETDGEEFIDEIKSERDERLDLYTRLLSAQDYINFTQARRAHFGRAKETKVAFNNWLLQDTKLKVNIEPGGLVILQYVAYETLAILVDYCFVVRRDQRASAAIALRQDSVLQHGVPVRCAESNSLFSTLAKGGEAAALVLLKDPITPTEVREALRRATTREPQIGYYSNNCRLPVSDALLAI